VLSPIRSALMPETNGRSGQRSNFIDEFLRSPIAGIAPWIVIAVFSGPGRFAGAAAGALGLSLAVLWVGGRRGIRVHSLEVFGAVVFAVFVGLGILGSPAVIDWLELWAGELANAGLASFAIGSLIVRRPFTMAYARDTVDAKHWNSPLFVRTNYILTGVWASAFLFSASVGAIGDVLWKDGDNFWTGWILQIAATLTAIAVTEFYPEYARAKHLLATGESDQPAPSVARLVDWLPPFIVGIGIAAWISEALSDRASISLIVIGMVAGALMRRYVPGSTDSVR
jgi:hypothetical protein